MIKSAVLRWIWEVYTERLTRAGRWFFWPTAAFLNFTATSPQLEAYIASCYAFGLWLVGLAGMLVFRPRVSLQSANVPSWAKGTQRASQASVPAQSSPAMHRELRRAVVSLRRSG